jgi:hypothetical protein
MVPTTRSIFYSFGSSNALISNGKTGRLIGISPIDPWRSIRQNWQNYLILPSNMLNRTVYAGERGIQRGTLRVSETIACETLDLGRNGLDS